MVYFFMRATDLFFNHLAESGEYVMRKRYLPSTFRVDLLASLLSFKRAITNGIYLLESDVLDGRLMYPSAADGSILFQYDNFRINESDMGTRARVFIAYSSLFTKREVIVSNEKLLFQPEAVRYYQETINWYNFYENSQRIERERNRFLSTYPEIDTIL